ncbi:MAG TPA: F390 synthetase-related protein [Ktedonobacteraceae bacterium]
MSGVKKLSIAAHFVRARWRWQHLRGADLERYQEQRARLVMEYAREHAPFYRSHWFGHDLRDWRALPVVDKRLMMASFDTFNTRGIRREQAMEIALRAERERDFRPQLAGLTIGLSSGTSGHRGLFLVSPREQAAWAGTILARALHTLPRGTLRVAFFLRSNSNLYEQVGSTVIRFRYFDLMLPLAEAVVALNDFQPHLIVGPPSLLGFLAREHQSGELRVRPQRLISVAEVLEQQEQRRIEAAFQAPVHQIYQCTEGLLAVSCSRGSLHIQEDAVALQFEPLSAGKQAEQQAAASALAGAASAFTQKQNERPEQKQDERVMPIVTDLWRTTQPIIRYRLNDVLQLAAQPCVCGSAFRVIRAIEGRCDDVCYFSSRAGGTRLFYPDTIRRMILLASQEIADYQVMQRQSGHLTVALTVAPGASFASVSASVLSSIQATIASYDCQPALVEIAEGIPSLVPGVKRRRVQRVDQGEG